MESIEGRRMAALRWGALRAATGAAAAARGGSVAAARVAMARAWPRAHMAAVGAAGLVLVGARGTGLVLGGTAAAEAAPARKTEEQQRREEERKTLAWRTGRRSGLLWRLWDMMLDALRLAQLSFVFAPSVLLLPAWLLLPAPAGREDWWLDVLVACVQRAGPTFVKLGQWASTRADLFGAPLRRSLRVLHDSVGNEPWWRTRATLQDAFGGVPPEEVFEELQDTPIGAGCIAQVHRARQGGRPVAIKVQRERVRRLIERDLSLLRRTVWLVTALLPSRLASVLELRESTALFSEFMWTQMDFHQEAANLEQFSRNFDGFRYNVAFPEALHVSENGMVLVESLEPGQTLSSLLEAGSCDDALRRRIGTVGVQSFLKMVLQDNFCHSDLHPGNILVSYDNEARPDSLRLAFLDVGLTTRLSETDQRNFVDLFAAVATGKGRRAGELMIERLDARKLERCTDPAGFVDGIERVVSSVQTNSFRLDRVKIGSVLEQVLQLVHQYQVPVDSNFTNLVLSIIVLEGLGRQLNPELDIFRESVPVLMSLGHKGVKLARVAASAAAA